MWRFLVGLMLIGMCAGGYLWIVYDPKVINIIELYTGMGVIFSSIGAIATVFVFHSTAQSTKNAIKSVEIAEASLQSSLENSRKDDFIKQLTLLLEQHNRSHDALAKSIDSNDGQLISDSSSFIQWDMTLEEASKKLFQNFQYSPYMRILYRNLKYINESFYLVSNNNKYIEEKKQYTAILRSVIRNDILFLVAINAKNEIKIFRKYEKMLKDFSFFEHIIVDNIGEKIKFNIDDFILTFKLDLEKSFDFFFNEYLNNKIYEHDELKEKNIFNGYITLKYSFVYELMREFSTWQYNLFKGKLINKIKEITFDLLVEKKNSFIIEPFFIENNFYLYKGDETGLFSSGSVIKNKKIIDEKKSISLIENADCIINKKINLDTKCVNLNDEIFFHKNNDADENVEYFQGMTEIKKQCCNIIRKKILSNLLENNKEIYIFILKNVIAEVNKTDFFTKMNEKLIVDSTGTILFEKQQVKKSCSKV